MTENQTISLDVIISSAKEAFQLSGKTLKGKSAKHMDARLAAALASAVHKIPAAEAEPHIKVETSLKAMNQEADRKYSNSAAFQKGVDRMFALIAERTPEL